MGGLILLLWLISPFACLAIASGKGRSAFGWFLLGLVFGPMALLAVAIISPDRLAQEKRALRAGLQSGKMRRCPHCAEVIQTEARVCRHCGRDV